MSVFGKEEGEGGSPSAGSDYGNFTHFLKLDSVPDLNLFILDECLEIIKREEQITPRVSGKGLLKTSMRTMTSTATINEPSET